MKLDATPSLAGKRIAIIGGSLGGLSAANVLTRLGASVIVFEKRPKSLENNGACLGFVDVALWERVRGARMTWPDGRDVTRVPPPVCCCACCPLLYSIPLLTTSLSPLQDGRRSFENQGSFFYGDMCASPGLDPSNSAFLHCLLLRLLTRGGWIDTRLGRAISLLWASRPAAFVFGCSVETLGDDIQRPTVDGEVFDLAIIADGGFSTLRNQYIDVGCQPDYTG
ncbi:NAD-binding protein [bacterium]|nr:NAD-binding protein [bacterium]